MHSSRGDACLACRRVAGLFALILLGAPPPPQAQVPPMPHKQAPTDRSNATKCTPPALREALSARHVMPDVQGCAYQAVQGYFAEFGKHTAEPRDEASPLVAGTVTRQVPGPGTVLATGEPVTLHVSNGVPPVPQASKPAVVPEVVGLSARAAVAAIRARRLRPVFKGTEDGAHPRGMVSRTMPPGNTAVDSGAEVGYWTASGFNEVPDLHLRTLKEAGILLRQAGFRLGPHTGRSASDYVGRILDQQPMAHVRAELGTAMTTSMGQAAPGNGWLHAIAYALGAVLALGGGWWLRHLLRIARTRRLLMLKPSRDLDGTVRFGAPPHFNAPTVTLRSRLEDGGTRFRAGLTVLHVEIRDE